VSNSELISLFSVLIALVSLLGGSIAWYRGIVQKKYAAERDFGHLKRSFEALSQNLGTMNQMLDQRFDRLDLGILELKALSYRGGRGPDSQG